MRKPRKGETRLERRVRMALVRAGLRFHENYAGFKVAQPDFWLPDFRAVIEVDSVMWHHTTKQLARDRQKDGFYRSLGLRVFRFPEADVYQSADACVARMLRALKMLSFPPDATMKS